jgi:hypothetical protein
MISDECEALTAALRRARPGDLVIAFCDDYKNCWKAITGFDSAASSSGSLPSPAAPEGQGGKGTRRSGKGAKARKRA